jgi:hypothetical protein
LQLGVRIRGGLTFRRRLGAIARASIGVAGGAAGTKGLRRRMVGRRQRRWRHFEFMLGNLKFASARICETKYRENEILKDIF